jgi:CubicO group peptidase (beta-lactamase class C family)
MPCEVGGTLRSSNSDTTEESLGMGNPGLTKAGLDRFHAIMSAHVERGDVPGLVALVARGNDVHIETLGTLAIGNQTPMCAETVFRVASLTKIATAVAGMILIEECLMRLDDSIERWIPELAERRVLKSIASPLSDTVPATRAITVRDVFTYRMGIGSVISSTNYPIQQAIREYKIGGDGPPRPSQAPPEQEWLDHLGALPLIAQPGERFMYNVSGDVLGVLISRVSGMRFGEFLRQRIFEPLGMKDTAFSVSPEQLDRFPACYMPNRDGSLDQFDGIDDSAWRTAPFESGAGGLVSTMDDWFAFSRTLLNNGRHDGERILSRASIELMSSDQLTPENRIGAGIFFGSHSSWGLGVAVDIARHEIYHSPGRYGWTGGTGTTAYVDPANNLVTILFTQRMMNSPEPPKVFTDFFTAAYAALE